MIRAAALGKLQYKTDFLVGVVSILFLNTVNISVLAVLVFNFGNLGGWTMWQLLFLYSLWNAGRGLYSLLFWHLYNFEDLIVSGNFDVYMMRPVSPFLQVLGQDIGYPGIGDMLVGIAGIALAKSQLSLGWGAGYWLFFVACVLAGALIQMAISWLCICMSFWTTRSRPAMEITGQFTVLVQQYPVNIFGRGFQIFTTAILPVAFLNFYPSLVLLGKSGEYAPVWHYFSPLVAVALLVVAGIVWTRGVKRYAGAGG